MNLSEKFSQFLVQQKKVNLLLCLVFVVLVASQAANVGFSTNIDDFFGRDDPLLHAKHQMEEEFNRDYGIEFLLQFDAPIFNTASLQAIQKFSDKASTLPHAYRVNSLSNYTYIEVDGDDLVIEDLILEKELYSLQDVERVKSAIRSDEEISKYFINPRSDIVSVRAFLNIEGGNESKKKETYIAAKALVSDFENRYQNLNISLNGSLAFDKALEEGIVRDVMRVEAPMFLIIIVLMGALFRSFRAAIAAILMIVCSIGGAIGGAGILGYSLNVNNLLALWLIMFLAILDCVHLLSSYQASLKDGNSPNEAMRLSLEKNIEALFFTTLTTVFGFLALWFTNSPGFQQLGIIGAIGVAFAFLLTLFALPAVMLWGAKNSTCSVSLLRFDTVSIFKRLFVSHEKKVFLVSSLITVVTVPFMFNLYYDDVPIEMFKENAPIRKAYQLSESEFGGVVNLNYVLDSGAENGVFDKHYIVAVKEFKKWLEKQKEVVKVRDFTDVLKRINRKLNSDNDDYNFIPEERGELAQFTLLYELSLPSGASITDQLDLRKQKFKLEILAKHLSAEELIAFHKRVNDYLSPDQRFQAFYASSNQLLFAYISHNNNAGALKGWLSAFIAITLCMFIVCRSFKLGLLSILPNVIPILLTYGLWGLFVGKMTMMSVVLLLGIGVVVDDTIHFIIQYSRNLRKGLTPHQSVLAAYDSAGRAIVFSTVIMVSGFMVPALFADLVANNIVYLLLCTLMVMAMLFDLLILPSLLIRMPLGNRSKGE